LSMSKKIRHIMLENEVSQIELAKRLGLTQSNLANKFKRDNFTFKELQKIGAALGYEYEGVFSIKKETKKNQEQEGGLNDK